MSQSKWKSRPRIRRSSKLSHISTERQRRLRKRYGIPRNMRKSIELDRKDHIFFRASSNRLQPYNNCMDFGIIEKLSECIVRPPRSTYSLNDLGIPFIQVKHRVYQRDDFTVVNSKGLELQCSFMRDKFSPCARDTIIFLHANSSCRLTMRHYLDTFLPYFDLLSFDFAGCGHSQGQFVTLGYNEREDLYRVIAHVRQRYGVTQPIIWGRSMGAATAILYAAKYSGVRAVIADSSFSDLQVLIRQLSDEYAPFLPSFLVEVAIDSIQEQIQEKVWKQQATDFQVRKLKPIRAIRKIRCPIYFIGSLQDTFVNVSHTRLLHKHALAEKHLELVKGDHNDLRTSALKEKVLKFLIELNVNPRASLKERRPIFESHKRMSSGTIEKISCDPYCYPEHYYPNETKQEKTASELKSDHQSSSQHTSKTPNKEGREPSKRRRIFDEGHVHRKLRQQHE